MVRKWDEVSLHRDMERPSNHDVLGVENQVITGCTQYIFVIILKYTLEIHLNIIR